jgi:hypothetical protein
MFDCLEIMKAGSTPELGKGFPQSVGPLLDDPESLDNIIES